MYRFALWGAHVRERGGAHKCPVCLLIKIDSVHNLWSSSTSTATEVKKSTSARG